MRYPSILLAALSLLPVATLRAEGLVSRLAPAVRTPFAAPQGIARDDDDGDFWVTSAISKTIYRLDASLRIVETVDVPLPPVPGQIIEDGFGGVAVDPATGSLWLTRPLTREIHEVGRDGMPTGRVVTLDLPPPPNRVPVPYPEGVAFDPSGDGGRGSLWVVDTVMTAIYEVGLDGFILGSFCHPDDPDGCPGEGRAAHASDVGLVTADGSVVAIELIGGSAARDRLVTVSRTGERLGRSFPLGEVGGRPGGFVRAPWTDPATGRTRDALVVTVESSGEIHVLATEDPALRPPVDLACSTATDGVRLDWRNTDRYDRIEILRDDELAASLPGDATSALDVPPPGRHDYTVRAVREGLDADATCSARTGAGEILAATELGPVLAVDLTEDGEERLWVTATTPENRILVFDKDLTFLGDVPVDVPAESSAISAIAADRERGRIWVYDAATNLLLELDEQGFATGRPPVPSGVSGSPSAPALVTAMLLLPAEEGEGLFLYLDATSGTVQERGIDGTLWRVCLHPDAAATPPPPESGLDLPIWGLSAGPGGDGERVELTGGSLRDQRLTRVFRLSRDSCARQAEEIPVDVLTEGARIGRLGIHRSRHRGREVLYAVAPDGAGSRLVELDATPPAVPAVAALSSRQVDSDGAVEVSLLPPEGIDAIELERDDGEVTILPGDTRRHVDPAPPAGVRTFRARAVRDGVRSDDRAASLRVGPGSVAARHITNPLSFVHQVAHDPVDGVWIAASTSPTRDDRLFRLDANLRELGSIESPLRAPRQVAALTVRVDGGRSEIWCLGWLPGAAHGTQEEFPLVAIDAGGTVLRSVTVRPPPPGEVLVPYPSGLAWDAARDEVWLLGRNARRVSRFSLDGELLGSFPHPASPWQDGVHNFGLAIDPARGTIYLSTAGRLSTRIDRLVEVTRTGRLTGLEVHLGLGTYPHARGFALLPSGRGVLVASQDGSVSDLVEHRVFSDLDPVEGLTASREEGAVRLAWTVPSPPAPAAIEIWREQWRVAELPGVAEAWTDPAPPECETFYRVVPAGSALPGRGVVVSIGARRPFLRGDAFEDGALDITDAIVILDHLFLGGPPPRCADAADSDDNGRIDISDPIRILVYLFLSPLDPPRAPFPSPGCDPTDDTLGCDG